MTRHPVYPKSDDLLAFEQQLTERRLERVRYAARERQRGLMVLMEDVHNPHNLAAIARSCDAFGVQNIGFTATNQNLFDPEQVGRVSSSSASKWLDYHIYTDGTRTCLESLKADGWQMVATVAAPEAVSIYEMDFTRIEQMALLVGNEHAGLSDEAISLADHHVTIPMRGMIHSFNVSVATAITLAEITRQRDASPQRFTVDDDEAQRLLVEFIRRSLPIPKR
jgi:tRNA (guanosine-2'-O-)-methyltransferase